jgi:hypothetical protein
MLAGAVTAVLVTDNIKVMLESQPLVLGIVLK